MPIYRRLMPYGLTVIVFVMLYQLTQTLEIGLKHSGIYSGIFLLGCFLVCLLWDRFATASRAVHSQIGLLSIALFFNHSGLRLPGGIPETMLVIGFLMLGMSGLFGAFISTSLTKRLAHLPTSQTQDAVAPDVFCQRELLREKAESILLKTIKQTGSVEIEQLYIAHLNHYFSAPSHTFAHMIGVSPIHLTPFTFINMALKNAGVSEKAALDQLRLVAKQKFDLDKYTVLLMANDHWRICHKIIAWCSMVLVVAHALLVFSFTGVML